MQVLECPQKVFSCDSHQMGGVALPNDVKENKQVRWDDIKSKPKCHIKSNGTLHPYMDVMKKDQSGLISLQTYWTKQTTRNIKST